MKCDLTLHPECASAVRRIEVEMQRDLTVLRLRYTVSGAMEALLLPAPRPAQRTDELWRHTCFEVFVREPGDDGYLEFNFSPSTEWAAYQFDAYRSGMRNIDNVSVEIAAQAGSQLTIDARVALPGAHSSDLLIGLSAVVEEISGRKSYWALAHAPGAPDFHHATAFCLTLPAITAAETPSP